MKLSKRKTPLVFETNAIIQGREISVEATPWMAVLRLKGTRHKLQVSWEGCYMLAAKAAAEIARATKSI